jgi:hypothetical protein
MSELRQERLRHEGLLGEKERQAKSLRLKCEALRDAVRSTLDPFEPIEELNIEAAFETMSELLSLYVKLLEELGDIKHIRKALGRE